ncbi:hypothetical protein Glove_546g14 [Diversispora epigaea]|uniref:Uncharacterized protein n=1 Tax=Diversispora epigaea TaxID=1348612 RepID=A0A397GC34_9GLOM|nr:hypothetical protein Glove_546g14 [Diversispora epigaea]
MVEWSNAQICTLIDERRNRNIEYYNFGRNRNEFWNSITNRINQEYNTSFNGHHCKEQFSNLVRNYNVAVEHGEIIRVHNILTYFWERPEDEFDRIRNINTSNHRRNRDIENTISALSIEEVEHELGMRSSVRRINWGSSDISRRSHPIPL